MRIRLTRRLAEHINGIDLSGCAVGDVIDLSQHDAHLLVAEGWALLVPVEGNGDPRRLPKDTAAESVRRRKKLDS